MHCRQDIPALRVYTAATAKDEQVHQHILIIGVLFPAIPLMVLNFGNR